MSCRRRTYSNSTSSNIYRSKKLLLAKKSLTFEDYYPGNLYLLGYNDNKINTLYTFDFYNDSVRNSIKLMGDINGKNLVIAYYTGYNGYYSSCDDYYKGNIYNGFTRIDNSDNKKNPIISIIKNQYNSTSCSDDIILTYGTRSTSLDINSISFENPSTTIDSRNTYYYFTDGARSIGDEEGNKYISRCNYDGGLNTTLYKIDKSGLITEYTIELPTIYGQDSTEILILYVKNGELALGLRGKSSDINDGIYYYRLSGTTYKRYKKVDNSILSFNVSDYLLTKSNKFIYVKSESIVIYNDIFNEDFSSTLISKTSLNIDEGTLYYIENVVSFTSDEGEDCILINCAVKTSSSDYILRTYNYNLSNNTYSLVTELNDYVIYDYI